ncbi:hypothetical protein QCA50_015578 [Cerrena zonata]|uniref:Uncharacterized protein n=1 Tax=Cerrena zonata TaxID=2478898 RepID=A0AAW0FLI0_9APHY
MTRYYNTFLIETSKQRMMLLPPEVLIEIIAIVLVDYLEDIMPDIAVIRHFRLERPFPFSIETKDQAEDFVFEQIREDDFKIVGPYDRNHFAPLLETSYQIRDVAISVLSNVFCIPRTNGRLSMKPWTCIKSILTMYTNPKYTIDDINVINNPSSLLRLYAVVPHVEWQTWFWRNLYEIKLEDLYRPKIEDQVMHSLKGASKLHRNPSFPPKVLVRTAMSLLDCVFGPMFKFAKIAMVIKLSIQSQINRMFADIMDQNKYGAETAGDISMVLRMVEELYGERGLLSTDWIAFMDMLPPDVVTEIIENVYFEKLRPVVIKITQLPSQLPEWEACRKSALDVLDLFDHLPSFLQPSLTGISSESDTTYMYIS